MCVAIVYLHGFSGLEIKPDRCSCPGLFEPSHIPVAFSPGMLCLMNEKPDVSGTSSLG